VGVGVGSGTGAGVGVGSGMGEGTMVGGGVGIGNTLPEQEESLVTPEGGDWLNKLRILVLAVSMAVFEGWGEV
jgi:hypothetical protein